MANFWRDREADAVSDYWNAVIVGSIRSDHTAAVPDIDLTLLATIARIRKGRQRHLPDPAFVDRLETTLMNAQVTSIAIQPPRLKELVVRPEWLPTREVLFPRKWSLAAAATIALIILTLATFLFATRDPGQPVIAPGTPEEATPTAISAPIPTVVPVTMYRGGLDRTGVMPGPAPTGRPGVLWRTEAGAVIKGPLSVGNGLVFTGTDDGSVHAFDMTTGAEVWKLTGNTAFESPSIVLDGTTAYIAGYDGMVLAVDAVTGTEIWRTDPALNVSRRVAFDAATKALYVGGLEAVSYAFDSTTGQLKWQTPISSLQASVASIVAGDTLYFGTDRGVLYALNTADGTTRWTYESPHEGFGSLTFANNTIFGPVGPAADPAFVAVDATSGAERWEITSASAPYSAAAILDGNIIVGTEAGEVLSVAQADGQVNWTVATGNGAPIWTAPSIVGDDIYAVDTVGWLYALGAATGQEMWRVQLDDGINYGPAITGGVIYVGTWSGSVYALGDGGTDVPVATPVAGPPNPTDASPESSPGAVPGEKVEVLWETTGGEVGFAGPTLLAIAPDGTIWVADSGHAGFQIFDADGAFIESWTGTGDGQFGLVEDDGDPFGAVAFAADGSFYVLDPAARRVLAFSAERTFLRSIGERGSDPGQFLKPMAIVVDPAGNVAVWDAARGDVQTFAPDGTMVATARLQATYTGGESSNSMTVDGDGNFIVLEFDRSGGGLVEKFDPEGNLLLQFGLESGPGTLLGQPLGLGLDAAGNIYVTEIEPARVVVFSPEGEFLTEFGAALDTTVVFPFPFDVAVDSQGDVYVTDPSKNKLVKLHLPQPLAAATQAGSPDASPGAAATEVKLIWESTGGDGGLAEPSTIAIAPDGKIWVADAGNARFQIFDADGAFLESWTGTGEGQFGLTDSVGDQFGAVAFAADGSFYVLDPGARRILVFSADRTFLRSIGERGRGPGQFVQPYAIVTDLAGNVMVLDDARSDIQIFAPDGTLISTVLPQSVYTTPLSVNLMAIDGDRNIFVAEAYDDPSLSPIVEKFDPEGNLLQQFGDDSGPGSFGRAMSGQYNDQPVGIAVDAAGNVYITEIGTNPRIVVFSPDGSYLMEIGTGSSKVVFEFPFDVALDDQGNIYVTDLVQNRLVKLRLPESLAPATPEA
jgi:tripartite motif-containing protein 71